MRSGRRKTKDGRPHLHSSFVFRPPSKSSNLLGQTTKDRFMIRTRPMLWAIGLLVTLMLLGGAALANRTVRNEAQVLLGLEPAPQITPLALVTPAPRARLPS